MVFDIRTSAFCSTTKLLLGGTFKTHRTEQTGPHTRTVEEDTASNEPLRRDRDEDEDECRKTTAV